MTKLNTRKSNKLWFFLQLISFVRGGHFDNSPRATKIYLLYMRQSVYCLLEWHFLHFRGFKLGRCVLLLIASSLHYLNSYAETCVTSCNVKTCLSSAGQHPLQPRPFFPFFRPLFLHYTFFLYSSFHYSYCTFPIFISAVRIAQPV